MKQTHCKRITSRKEYKTRESFSTSAMLYVLTDLLVDQNCYRKIWLIWEMNPSAIVIHTRKGMCFDT